MLVEKHFCNHFRLFPSPTEWQTHQTESFC